MSGWTLADMPSQAGKLAVVTGATVGLAYETALVLAQAGGEGVLAARNPQRGVLRWYPFAPEWPAPTSFRDAGSGQPGSVAD